jgi:hypothetical protein
VKVFKIFSYCSAIKRKKVSKMTKIAHCENHSHLQLWGAFFRNIRQNVSKTAIFALFGYMGGGNTPFVGGLAGNYF